MRIKLAIIFSIVLLCQKAVAQQADKPKLAIVLSGGGARGIAHIPLLKVLDSLKVKPDLIVGTSMGSVVGGLYAMGYSADTIEYIAENMDWDRLLSNEMPYDEYNPSERDETYRYSVEVPFSESKLILPPGLIESQELSLFFRRMALAIKDIDDFDKYPIAYRPVSTDLMTGDLVVLEKGDVVAGIRSSMAIPTIFTPVNYKNQILVDGGVLDNFPVDVAQQLGAGLIIGSDVSGGFVEKGESSSLLEIMIQSSVITSAKTNKVNRSNCDLLLDHQPNLTYSAGDFKNASDILQQGRIATNEVLRQITDLTKPYVDEDMEVDTEPVIPTITYDRLLFTGIKKHHQMLLKRRFDIRESGSYTADEIETLLRHGYGTNLFSQLTYNTYRDENGDQVLEIIGSEKGRAYLKGAIHYDTERGAGIVANFTVRDFLGKNSRSLVTFDASETPQLRLQHQQYILNDKWWYRAEYLFERFRRSDYAQGVASGNLTFNYQSITGILHRDLSNNTTISLGYSFMRDEIVPNNDELTNGVPRDSLLISDGLPVIQSFDHTTHQLQLQYVHNSLNKRFFSTSGKVLTLTGALALTNDATLDYFSEPIEDFDFVLGRSSSINLHYLHNHQLGEKSVLKTTVYVGNQFAEDENYFSTGFLRYQFLGGVQTRANTQYIPMAGLREGELPVSQLGLLRLSWQYELLSDLYVIPALTGAVAGFGTFGDFVDDFSNLRSNYNNVARGTAYILSAEARLGYMSPIGPIVFSASRPTGINDFRFYLGVGFTFL